MMLCSEGFVTDCVVMVSPDHFQFNEQTGETNSFQNYSFQDNVGDKARKEFAEMVGLLRENKLQVIVLSSRSEVITPDAVFPNNWFSVHFDATTNKQVLVLYPMFTENRRWERQAEQLLSHLASHEIFIDEMIDLTRFELCGKALEGTGSLVLDRANRVVYASRSSRMNEEVLAEFCRVLNYRPVTFSSYCTSSNSPEEVTQLVYHTNVVMSVGKEFVVICREAIQDTNEWNKLMSSFEISGKKDVVEISIEQMKNMCGNILQLSSQHGDLLIVLSSRAYGSFTESQRAILSRHGRLVHSDIATIETVGGGSARCMLAEMFHG